MDPIIHNHEETLSFRQVDELNGLPKGTSFRLFKRAGDLLQEGSDFHYLPATQYEEKLHALKRSGQIYETTRHLVLLTRSGYARLQSFASEQARPSTGIEKQHGR